MVIAAIGIVADTNCFRLPAPLAAFGGTVTRHAGVIYIVESQIYPEFFAITETLALRHQLGFHGGPLDV